jgi:protein SCO1
MLGLIAIKARQPELHKKIMLSAFGVSVAFLMCYLTYHFSLHYFTGEGSRKYTGTGIWRTIYFTILISHVFLAAFVPVLAIITIHKGIRQNWKSHHRWAKITFPLWMYVSITGVVVYVMLYQS